MSKPTETATIESALTAIEGILTPPILPHRQRGLIDGMLWAITGKYTTRYPSLSARNAPKGTKLQHEHVIPRKQLLAAIMLHPERAREIARTAIGCAGPNKNTTTSQGSPQSSRTSPVGTVTSLPPSRSSTPTSSNSRTSTLRF